MLSERQHARLIRITADFHGCDGSLRIKSGKIRCIRTLAEKAVATGEVVFALEPSHSHAKSDERFPHLLFLPGFFSFPRLALAAAVIMALVGIGWMAVELSHLRSQVDQAQARRLALEQREREMQEMLEQQRMAGSAIQKELERMREEKDRLERQMALERQIAQSQSPTLLANLKIVPFKLAAPTRTAGQVTTITMSSGAGYLALQVELEPDDYPTYNAQLLTQPGKKAAGWRRGGLKSKALGESREVPRFFDM